MPPKSLGETFKPYMAHLAHENTEPYQIVTHLTFNNKVLHFEPLDWVPEGMLDSVVKIVDSEDPDIVVGAKDRAIDSTQRLSAPPQQGAAQPQTFLTAAQAEQRPLPESQRVTTNRERELEEELAKLKALQASEAPKPRGRPKKEETIVGASRTFVQQAVEQTGQYAQSQPFIQSRGGIETPQPTPNAMNDMLLKAFGPKLGPK